MFDKMAIVLESRSVMWGSIRSLSYLKKVLSLMEVKFPVFHKCYFWGVKIKEMYLIFH